MTFLQLLANAKNKYQTNNQLVLFEILFFLSNKIKDKTSFSNSRNEMIDFNESKFWKLLDQYFIQQKPLGHILGYTKFCGIHIDIFKNIFEPRTETEFLVQSVVTKLKQNKKLVEGVDLCCGTGCVGIAIKKLCPWIKMTCIDINKKAIKNTMHNAKLNKVKINCYVGDFYQTLINKKLKFDFIVCNPPYVDQKTLNKKMTRYESLISFTNSDDPNYFYKTLKINKNKILNKNGFIAVETSKFDVSFI